MIILAKILVISNTLCSKKMKRWFVWYIFSSLFFTLSCGDNWFVQNKTSKLKCMCKYKNMILAGIYIVLCTHQHRNRMYILSHIHAIPKMQKCKYIPYTGIHIFTHWQSTFSISSSGLSELPSCKAAEWRKESWHLHDLKDLSYI